MFDKYITLIYIFAVAIKKTKEKEPKTGSMLLRLSPAEKETFQQCAMISGVSMSSWVRERLRFAAIKELESAGRQIPFLKNLKLD